MYVAVDFRWVGGSILDKWLTVTQYTKAMRLFQDDPKWTPLNRGEETDKNTFRQQYLQSRTAAAPVASH